MLNHCVVVFCHCFFDSRTDLFFGVDFGNAEAASVITWFDKTGQSYPLYDFLFAPLIFMSVTDDDAVGDIDTEGFEKFVKEIFVECQRLDQHVAG